MLDAGDVKGAVEALYARHADEVRRFVRWRVRPEVVDDVCQEVWVAVGRALPGFRGDASARVWVYAIAHRKIADAHRRHRSFATFDSDLAAGRLDLGRVTTPRSRLSRQRKIDAVRRLVDGFDEDDRELFTLRFVEGLKPREIAEVLGSIKPNTVSKRLERLLRRLHEQL